MQMYRRRHHRNAFRTNTALFATSLDQLPSSH